MQTEALQLERLVDDPEIRRAAAKTLKGFCLTYLPHHFPLELSDFFDEMCQALEDFALTVAKAVQTCANANAGNIKKAVEIALDIDQPFYEVTTLLNAANLINRIQDT
jgi:hypothetical protein